MGQFQSAVNFVKSVSTNGAQLPGQDYVSGMVFYDSSTPSSFPTSGIAQLFSKQDAINIGIDGKSADETPATGTYLFTAAGAAGDTIAIYTQEVYGSPVLLCLYTVTAADSTVTLLGASVATAINNNTGANGGYTATASTGTVTITARTGLGVFLNAGTPISVVITGTVAGTITQYSGGVASNWDTFYYHIVNFFKMNPNAVLWLGIFAVPSTYTFVELETLQTAANKGAIRQATVYTNVRTVVADIATDVATLNGICQTLSDAQTPLSAVLVEDMSAVTDLTTLPTLASLASPWVSVDISQDGNAQGNYLYNVTGKTVGNCGTILGIISANSVSASIGNPIATNNLAIDGVENAVPALGNGTLMSSVSKGQQTQFDLFRYIYAGVYSSDYSGTYYNLASTCTLVSSDYAYIQDNRVFGKIQRLLYAAYLPICQSQIIINADGTIFAPLIQDLQNTGNNALNVMTTAQPIPELSGAEVIIAPNQNVKSTGKLVVTLYEQDNEIPNSITINVNKVTLLP